MKRITAAISAIHVKHIFTLLSLVSVIICWQAEAVDLSKEFTIDFEKTFSIDSYNGYDTINWVNKDCTAYSPEGYPLMPVKRVRIAVPKGLEFAGIELTSTNTELLKGSYKLYPSQPAVPSYLRAGGCQKGTVTCV